MGIALHDRSHVDPLGDCASRGLTETRCVRDDVRRMLGATVRPLELCDRPVVAIVASSRSYSSLLFTLLVSTGRFVALPGEHVHLYKLAGVSLPLALDSDDATLNPSSGLCDRYLDLLEWELGLEAATHRLMGDTDALALVAAYRLFAQWGTLPEPRVLVPLLADAFRKAKSARAGDQAWLEALLSLRADGVDVDPRYYDVDRKLMARTFPALGALPDGPPGHVAVEEPPFVRPIPDRASVVPDAAAPLLLKASVDAYRLDLLRLLFGNRLTVVHLTRNPAGAISGLLDGWRSHCFHSHRLSPGTLDIRGYSEAPAGRSGWWKFDAPPGWQDMRRADLEEVCAHQWASAHEHILEGLGSFASVTVQGEELVTGGRQRVVDRVLEVCGLRSVQIDDSFDPVVMATAKPRAGRWRDRMGELRPVLKQVRVQELAGRLGYGSAEGVSSWT